MKKRVGGDFGHLTNAQARQFLDHADTTRLKMLFVAHISQQNNAPELADAALSGWSDLASCLVIHATQETGLTGVTFERLPLSSRRPLRLDLQGVDVSIAGWTRESSLAHRESFLQQP